MQDCRVFDKVLVANRGAIACRIFRTLRRLGISSVAVFSEADAGSLHVSQADESVCIGPAPASSSYLNAEVLIAAARDRGAQAIHPGYGFLSESADFAAQCAATGLVFVGPTPDNMRDFGLKHRARELAQQENVPLLPGSGVLVDLDAAREAATQVGFPIMLKATAGGGGIGMRVCVDAPALEEAYPLVSRLAANHFAEGGVFLERFVPVARHIEVQIFGDGAGRVVALGERDCSLQRRNQKIIEETPAPGLSAATRARMLDHAVQLASAAHYRSAGTVEFLFDAARDEFYFLEVNARLQVEHGVTEEVTGVDLVEWMIRGAADDYSFLDAWTEAAKPPPTGCSIQARLYAEDPGEDNRPSNGTITELTFPARARIETWITTGTEVSAYYDPLLAKLIVKAADRAGAVSALQQALDVTRISGPETNLEWLRQIVHSDLFVQGNLSTRALDSVAYKPCAIRVLAGGLATTVQDYPGRCGYWHVGVPPSGPMDSLAFRLGNRLLGNPEGTAGLEVTALGPTLRFDRAASLCLTGADKRRPARSGQAARKYRTTHADVTLTREIRLKRQGSGRRGGGAVGAHEDGDATGDDAVGLGVGELDGAHHGLVVDLTERQRGQMLGGQGGVVGVEQPGSGQLGQGFGDYGHDPAVAPEVEDRGEVRRLGNDQPDQGGTFGRPRDGPDDLTDARGQGLAYVVDITEVAVDDIADTLAHGVVRLAQDQEEQVLFVAVVAVDGALRHPGFGRDRVDAGALVAVPREQQQRGGGDRVVLALPARHQVVAASFGKVASARGGPGRRDVLHVHYCTTPFSFTL